MSSTKAVLLCQQHPLQARSSSLTPCLPRDHRDCPRDLCLIPAHSRQRMSSPEQLCQGRWPCIMPEVRTLGQRSAKTFVCPSTLLGKSPNNHLPFFRAYKAPKGSNRWIQQPKRVLQTSACHKRCFPEITSAVSFKCHGGR